MKYENTISGEIRTENELAIFYECSVPTIRNWIIQRKIPYKPYKRKIRCVETGALYNSRNELCAELGIAPSNLASHLKHHYPVTLKGNHYEEI